MRKFVYSLVFLASSLFSTNVPAQDPIIGDERAVSIHLQQSKLNELSNQVIIDHGRLLFDAKFTVLDGAGRPAATQAEVPVKRSPGATPALFRTSGPEANACNGCHNQPNSGGSGEFVVNVFSSEGVSDFEFDTLEAQFSNERNTPHIHGSGFVELLAREMTAELHAIREKAVEKARSSNNAVTSKLITKGIDFGELTVFSDGFIDITTIKGIDHDLIVRPFSQKGVFTSLRQFSINAMNAHHGMQSDERWGKQWTDSNDFDEDGFENEISSGDLTSLVTFQATLPLPVQIFPEHKILVSAVKDGEILFTQANCSQCHIRTLPLNSLTFVEPGPYNAAGNLRQSDNTDQFEFELPSKGLKKNEKEQWLIPVFSDFKRHIIADSEKPHYGNERLSQRFIPNNEFLSTRLWGVGSTAPYGHRGDITTIKEAILHHGGDAKDSRLLYEEMNDLEQRQIVEYLKSLQLIMGDSS